MKSSTRDPSSRYAIYYVPPADSALFRLGSALLGYDCRTGEDLTPPDDAHLPLDWSALVAPARRYGFHGTLKAPFRHVPGRDEEELCRTVDVFAQVPRERVAVRPVVRALGAFVAVVPAARDAALDGLGADCVTRFDAFRAPMTAADRTRRLTAPLSMRELQNLDRWGYPYVFEDFRFHMTLTGPIDASRRDGIVSTLSTRLVGATNAGELVIDRIALVRQDSAEARFRVVHDAVLSVTDTTNSALSHAGGRTS
jgi:hypothetical protein